MNNASCKPLPQVDALLALRMWSEFEPMCLKSLGNHTTCGPMYRSGPLLECLLLLSSLSCGPVVAVGVVHDVSSLSCGPLVAVGVVHDPGHAHTQSMGRLQG
ncbi:hypothetical protein E2C01_084027 [Portunus trituberculatus]|uniref:Uncharacterized protein n=1 Tax=Portunus trituberculatus TaxID=210409 RepID=A0A5B7J2X8_PORTR|nr:hypothetical protein [Portunus trituberculatus]